MILYLLFKIAAAAVVLSLQLCPTLCDPIDGSPWGSPIPGVLQARTLEWVAISFSYTWKWKWSCSVVSDFQRPHGLQPTRLLRPWDFQARVLEWGDYSRLGLLISKGLALYEKQITEWTFKSKYNVKVWIFWFLVNPHCNSLLASKSH